jgi:hypothetical protein
VITYLVDVVLIAALAATALRVGAMHRELRRLRGYQTQYVQVFGETSRAADSIGDALRQIGGDGQGTLVRLESAIARAGELAGRLEAMARAAEPQRGAERVDDPGLYTRRPGAAAQAQAAPKNEILKFAGDSRRLPEPRAEALREPRFSPLLPEREIRLAPSVKELSMNGGAR